MHWSYAFLALTHQYCMASVYGSQAIASTDTDLSCTENHSLKFYQLFILRDPSVNANLKRHLYYLKPQRPLSEFFNTANGIPNLQNANHLPMSTTPHPIWAWGSISRMLSHKWSNVCTQKQVFYNASLVYVTDGTTGFHNNNLWCLLWVTTELTSWQRLLFFSVPNSYNTVKSNITSANIDGLAQKLLKLQC